jgi:hypothetical protein
MTNEVLRRSSMAITVTTTKVIVDETTGVQLNGSTGAGDLSGNEFVFGAAGAPTVPSAFSAALTDVATGLPSVGALSGFSTTASTGVNVIDYGGTIVTGAAFVGSNGLPLSGVDSGLQTTDGTSVFLYTYSLDNNVLFGVKGNVNPEDDIANAPIVFAAYLQETSTGVKAWLVQYESMFNDTLQGNTAAAYDDPVSPDNVIFVALSQQTSFSLTGAPSGQNLFLMYGTPGDGNAGNGDEVALIVTATNAASGGTVNTGQGGGGTTIGSNNQMLDAGEGLTFTFVTNADANFTVPNLTSGEAGNVDNLNEFGGLFSSTSASFTVVQTQPNSKAGTLTLKAYTTDLEKDATGANSFLGGYADDVQVNITSVVIKDAAGNTVNLSVDLSGLGATIVGVKAGYTITYTTAVAHQRAEISNTGVENTKTGADFDIGGFSLPSTTTTQLPFTALVFQDDGLSATGTAQTNEVDEDGLAGGNPGGLGDLNADDGTNDNKDGSEITATGNVSAIFVAGADGIASYGVSADTSGLSSTLTSKGEAVVYDVDTAGTMLTAYVDSGSTKGSLDGTDRTVFTLAITAATGAYTFSLADQLDHSVEDDPNTKAVETSFEDDISLQLGSVVMAKDGDKDFVVAAGDRLVITVDDDSPDNLAPAAAGVTIANVKDATGSAALGYFGNVGADEEGSVTFVGTNGSKLTGDIVGNGIAAPEPILADGSDVYLFGFGTSTLVATTDATNTDAASKVLVMTLNPDGSVQADDLWDITLLKSIAALQDVPFGNFTVAPSSGNPLTLVVNDIGGSTVDAFFSGFEDKGDSKNASSSTQVTVNVATVGVGVGTGQDFNSDANGAGTADDVSDRIRIEFLEDDGDKAIEAGEATTVNRFTFIMNQNNSPADDGDLLVRVYDINGTEVEITGIQINGTTLVGSGGAPVASNDGTTVTATDIGLGYILRGLGGGTGGSTADNDTVTIITSAGYARIDITGIGQDLAKDTFDILLKSLAVPTPRDITFAVQAALTDEDGDTSAPANLNVTLDADGVFVTTVGTGDPGIV